MNIVKKLIASALILTGVMFYATPATVHASLFTNSKEAACQGVQSADCGGGEAAIDSALGNVINLLSLVVGIVAVIMIIIGGFRYITSGGDSNGISSAKNTILYAIVGLVIAVLAQIIVRFVLAKV
jgi:hypothetical protein